MYLLGQLESFLRLRPPRRTSIPPAVLRVGIDLVGGGVMGWALASVLGTHAAASLLAGASMLAGYSYVVSHFLWGDVLDGIVRFASGHLASARGPDFSREKALAARGQVDEALELYEQWCDLRPNDPGPVMNAAFMLREARRYDEALAWYRRALDAPRLDSDNAVRVVRHIWDITATKLHEPALALPDMERLLREHPGAAHSEWVLREVEELGGQFPLAPDPPRLEDPAG
jgi:tetratricopeptide (TPR) repeat protein